MTNYYTGTAIDPILLDIKAWAVEGSFEAPFAEKRRQLVAAIANIDSVENVSKVLTPRENSNVTPILPNKLAAGLNLLQVDPIEISQQITIQQMELYVNIKVSDCWHWAHREKTAIAGDSTKTMVSHSNKVNPGLLILMTVDGMGCSFNSRSTKS